MLANCNAWSIARPTRSRAHWVRYIIWSCCHSINRAAVRPLPPPIATVPVLLGKRKGRERKPKDQSKDVKGVSCEMNYSYGIAAESTTSSPCSNVPIHCPICPKTDPAIWKYFMKVHFKEKHKTLNLTKYERLWKLSNFKRSDEEDMDKTGKGTSQTNKKVKSSAAGDIREPSCANSWDVRFFFCPSAAWV